MSRLPLRRTAMRARAAYGAEGLRPRRRCRRTLTEPFLDAIDRLAARAQPERTGATERAQLLGAERLEQERRRGRRVVQRASASGARGSTRRRRAGAPPRRRAPGPRHRLTARALGKRAASIPTTTTWSNSRPFVACAVARRQRGVVAAQLGQAPPAVQRSRARERRRDPRTAGRPRQEHRGRRRRSRSGRRGVAARRRASTSKRLARPDAAPATSASSPSSARVLERQLRAAAAPERHARAPWRPRRAGISSRFGPGEDRPRRVVVGPVVRMARSEPDRVVRRVGREDEPAVPPPGPARIRFANRSPVVARPGGRRARRPAAGTGS